MLTENKMTMKKIYLSILLIIVLIISGCTQLNNLPRPSLPGLSSKEKVITESQGLTIRFLENQPPLDEIRAGQNFKISLDLTNNDPEQVTGTIKISDTPSDEFSSLQGKEEMSFSLPAAELLETKIAPSTERITFGPYSYDESKVFTGMVTNFITEIITNHKTLVASQFCIKSSSSQEINCPNKETITKFNPLTNLGPVKVSRVEKTMVPEEGFASLTLKIFLRNTARGKIDNEDQTIDSFNVDIQGETSLVCSKTNKISLKEGENVITCTADIGISDELFRQEVLEISFEYPYKIIETLGPVKVTKIEI